MYGSGSVLPPLPLAGGGRVRANRAPLSHGPTEPGRAGSTVAAPLGGGGDSIVLSESGDESMGGAGMAGSMDGGRRAERQDLCRRQQVAAQQVGGEVVV